MTLTTYLISALLLLAIAYPAFRIIGRHDYLRKGRWTLLSIFLATLVWVGWVGFPWIYISSDWPDVHVGAILETVGWIFHYGGLAIIFIGLGTLGLWRSFGQKSSELKQTGLYRFSRNPQITGCALYGIGFAVLWPSWYTLGWLILLAPIAHLMVITEEEHLRKVYGEKYARYCDRVPRYLGFPRG